MRIGELADLAGVTVRTIRYYQQKSVLAEPERRANGYGDYTVDHLVALVRIRQLTQSGLSLEHAGAIVAGFGASGDETLDEVDAALGQRIAALTAQRERLAAARAAGRIGLSKLAAALVTTPSDISASTLFAHLYGDDERADRLAETLQCPEVRSRLVAAQTQFEAIDENTTTAELDDLAADIEGIVSEFLSQVPTVTERESRLLLTLAERDLNDRQRAFVRRLT
ncbi:MerR family transcriptional regulator [Brevibacterium sp. UCMA 11754]|uniref:MerR family transcriptional regulator n=1 Tax=Brevibacterium sp. UCMA 11754 TaxID=2749198 RepID=UPI001F18EAE5|nr:MerR family transcriptional regulator [Brevibacterium sp. UCMA 11754]MCF2573797.1 MerR family transcriptional regulator [Brevibacterium sp. UCMA 11754]